MQNEKLFLDKNYNRSIKQRLQFALKSSKIGEWSLKQAHAFKDMN